MQSGITTIIPGCWPIVLLISVIPRTNLSNTQCLLFITKTLFGSSLLYLAVSLSLKIFFASLENTLLSSSFIKGFNKYANNIPKKTGRSILKSLANTPKIAVTLKHKK